MAATRLKIFISNVQKEFADVRRDLKAFLIGDPFLHRFAHRDYHSHASVEVRLFADRLEVWNPGMLPGTLTLDDLRTDHPSIPANPLIAESLYLARYIEKAGSGTQRMIELCRDAGLPAPDFELRANSFVITLWRDWLTDEALAGLNLNERQLKAIAHLKAAGRITNTEFQKLAGGSRRTALRELSAMVETGVLHLIGAGRGSYYILAGKRANNTPNAPTDTQASPEK